MDPTFLENPVSGVMLSSVVPGELTDQGKDHELANMDLALKLHYIRGLYFFKSEAVEGLTISDLKMPMFPWLALYFTTAGRIRRSEAGRHFIKCNDCGVRIVEAQCEKTIDEWFTRDDRHLLDNHLVYDGVLGPDLGIAPLVYIQFTWFKCGGMSVGVSWAHVLGDPFSVTNFINMWGQILQGRRPPKNNLSTPPRKPFSLKQVDPVGDLWQVTDNSELETHSFNITPKHLQSILSSVYGSARRPANMSLFNLITAIIWKYLSKAREDSGPSIVTVCTRTNNKSTTKTEVPGNNMRFNVVQADFSVAKVDVSELAELIAEKQEEENSLISETVEAHQGNLDCILYGENLTFVNLEEAGVYDLELKEQKPVFANYTIRGVGDEGIVLVLPGRSDYVTEKDVGRTVTAIFPGDQLTELRKVLRQDLNVI
ncbi:hypothetical protein K2173_028497 [Erythroxylum novogranatense]|uniref:Uncharacterized protein n=1 Tax=Erythroxylum novogranatense TaxID=1862640 RepID=A0AAV8U266_9ROSI|nr:hypothetical protein K2173_028497 [Erythroxylum novogranatense]